MDALERLLSTLFLTSELEWEEVGRASLETDLPRLRPMTLSESLNRLDDCESTDFMEARSSVEELVGADLAWLRFRKLLLPIRRRRPSGCVAAPLFVAAAISPDEAGNVLTLSLLGDLLPLPPPIKFLILLLLPKKLRRLKPALDA